MLSEYAVDHSVTEEEPRWSLSDLIEPVDVAEFARQYWEKRPLVVQRDTATFYKGLLTLDDMDAILSESSLHESEVQVVTSGRRLAGSGEGSLEDLYAQYRSGATITVKFVHRRWAPLRQLCRSLSTNLTAAIQVNAYLTPAGAQGFSTHYDTHDVFVAQVYGSKHWRLYDSPRRLPESSEYWVAPEDGAGQPARELDLCSGDLLYLPRGTLHDATSNDVASLHVTIGVHPVTWASVLREALNEVISEDPRYREALPIGFGSDADLARRCQDRLAELIAGLASSVRPGPLIGAAARKIRACSQPSLRGHLLDIEAVDSIGLDTPVRGRPGLVWQIAEDSVEVSLEFHGKVIRLPARVAPELRFAAGNASFTGRDLPGHLDEPGRVVLVSTLVKEGFLTVS